MSLCVHRRVCVLSHIKEYIYTFSSEVQRRDSPQPSTHTHTHTHTPLTCLWLFGGQPPAQISVVVPIPGSVFSQSSKVSQTSLAADKGPRRSGLRSPEKRTFYSPAHTTHTHTHTLHTPHTPHHNARAFGCMQGLLSWCRGQNVSRPVAFAPAGVRRHESVFWTP